MPLFYEQVAKQIANNIEWHWTMIVGLENNETKNTAEHETIRGAT